MSVTYVEKLRDLGVTQTELSAATGISRNSIVGFLNGYKSLAPANLAKIDAYLSGIADGTIPRPTPKRRASALDSAAEFPVPSHLADVWPAYLDIRKGKRAANTPNTLRLILAKLNRLAPNDHAKQLAIVEQSIDHAWIGVFELHEYNPRQYDVAETETDEEFEARMAERKRRRAEQAASAYAGVTQ